MNRLLRWWRGLLFPTLRTPGTAPGGASRRLLPPALASLPSGQGNFLLPRISFPLPFCLVLPRYVSASHFVTSPTVTAAKTQLYIPLCRRRCRVCVTPLTGKTGVPNMVLEGCLVPPRAPAPTRSPLRRRRRVRVGSWRTGHAGSFQPGKKRVSVFVLLGVVLIARLASDDSEILIIV